MEPGSPSAQEIISAMLREFSASGSTQPHDIPKSRVLEWMRSPDLEVRGALYSVITESEPASRVKPPLQFEDYYAFVVDYLEQCIEQGPDGEWADSRYLAGHQLVSWITHFWNDEEVPRVKLAEIKQRLASLYKRGDEDVRDAILNGVLEHLFENPQLARYYKDWENDPILSSAYSDALLWSKKGGGK